MGPERTRIHAQGSARSTSLAAEGGNVRGPFLPHGSVHSARNRHGTSHRRVVAVDPPRGRNAVVRLGLLGLVLAAVLSLSWYRSSHPVTVSVARLPSGRIFVMEDSGHSALQSFRKQEGIDRVVAAGGKDEFGRLLSLAKWTSQLFPVTTPLPNYPPWNAAELLRLIRAGETGGFCSQYAFVFAQSCQSLGYQVRYCDLVAADAVNSHFVPEVYLPSRRRWVVFEPQFGSSYTDGQGTPLGVIDLHEIQRGLRAGRVFEAPSGIPVPQERIKLFHYYRYYQRNNFLSVPAFYTVRLVGGSREWLFEKYRPLCQARVATSEPRERDEFDFIPGLEGARRTFALSADSFLGTVCGEEFHRVIRITTPARVLDEVVQGMLTRDLEYHPLDGNISWWPVPPSRSPLPGSKLSQHLLATGP